MTRLKMFLIPLLLTTVILGQLFAQPDPDFDQYFIDATMRVDYSHMGDAHTEFISLGKIYQQGIWAGSTTQLIDRFNQGRYYVKIYDANSGRLIFSRGFDSMFGEYQTTTPALNGVKHTYQESALIPYPRSPVIFAIEARDRRNQLHEIFNQEIDPGDVNIIKDPLSKDVKTYQVVHNGDPHVKVDVVMVAEGYTAKEEKKVRRDLQKFKEVFFSQEPYASHAKDFNLYGVFRPSDQSGVDEPTHGTFVNTAVDASFNSLGSPRYILTEDNQDLRDIAAHVPYDAIYIMINHARYGGGGIYNLYCTFTTDNQWYKYLFLHEFGHSFGGLADEYYSSSTSYNDFYPLGIEPTEKNITALVPDTLKWADLATPGIQIPTPWHKAEYDSLDESYQKVRQDLNEQIARLKRNNAPESQVQALEARAEELSRENAEAMDNFLETSPYAGKVGAFEGAGYSSEGLYRPMIDCIMFSKGDKPFCKVCEQAIIEVISHYTK